jgi:hypothetical protein
MPKALQLFRPTETRSEQAVDAEQGFREALNRVFRVCDDVEEFACDDVRRAAKGPDATS